ncbi:urease accessory protein UreF [Methyloprofundus sedimenti]|uniref:Urease accessory protein UreF n=1 Tax=Methyloprofundus sedimenti TaxID=1420851 RepID=A0A1V8M1W7_9GAMM|nr:urease accessory protein UreF [Methyloprofundus sedimenti]OQK15522.1 urease accessory protein UreF [Methyloprofundus sedimenti]
MDTDLALLRLLQLVSPGLPIGVYSYSQGFESAVEESWVNNAQQAGEWIAGLLEQCLVQVDIPVAARLYDAWQVNDLELVEQWSMTLLACRETFELREEDRQTGQALARLLTDMQLDLAQPWIRQPITTLPTMFALAAVSWGIPKRAALAGYLWGWLENQVLCAVKLVPLGQVAGQRLLHDLAAKIPDLLEQSLQLSDDDIGGSVFGLALASSRHEMQYSRLFRS